MRTQTVYTFRKVTPEDLGLISTWRAAPHVARWWGNGSSYSEKDLSDSRVDRRIVCHAGRPFAFMQDYSVHGLSGHHFEWLPPGSRGIDQFVGEDEMLGSGHGTAFIGLRISALFGDGVPIIATDPHPDNAIAIAVYRKLGFEIAGKVQSSDWGDILPMTLRPARR